jgi:hypothetical protein
VIDSRADSPTPLTPPPPLPFVSRRALRRVKDTQPIPTQCHYCQGAVSLESNAVVYRKEYGDWPYLYLCDGCGAYVGLHPGTDLPLGTLADKVLRIARTEGKREFIRFYQANDWDRNKAYHWLARTMAIPRSHCHWGWFNIEQCEQAHALCLAATNCKEAHHE